MPSEWDNLIFNLLPGEDDTRITATSQEIYFLTKVLGKTKTGFCPCEAGPDDEAVECGIVVSH